MRTRFLGCALILPLLLAAPLQATETENLGISVLPAPGKVAVDGKIDDWDLSGGVFACGDVENQREQVRRLGPRHVRRRRTSTSSPAGSTRRR